MIFSPFIYSSTTQTASSIRLSIPSTASRPPPCSLDCFWLFLTPCRHCPMTTWSCFLSPLSSLQLDCCCRHLFFPLHIFKAYKIQNEGPKRPRPQFFDLSPSQSISSVVSPVVVSMHIFACGYSCSSLWGPTVLATSSTICWGVTASASTSTVC